MKGIQHTWDKKLQFISKLLNGLQDEVANAPAPVSPDDEDTYQSRSFNLKAQENLLEEAQQVFVRWKINFLRCIKIYKDAVASEKETIEPKPAAGGTGSGHHSPTRTKNPSTSDAKALCPDILDTSLPSMQMKDWYKKWTNYMQASGWGQEGNERTKLAYLCTVVSDEICMVINYDSITTEARAIHEIKTYLNEAVIPITLQGL